MAQDNCRVAQDDGCRSEQLQPPLRAGLFGSEHVECVLSEVSFMSQTPLELIEFWDALPGGSFRRVEEQEAAAAVHHEEETLPEEAAAGTGSQGGANLSCSRMGERAWTRHLKGHLAAEKAFVGHGRIHPPCLPTPQVFGSSQRPLGRWQWITPTSRWMRSFCSPCGGHFHAAGS